MVPTEVADFESGRHAGWTKSLKTNGTPTVNTAKSLAKSGSLLSKNEMEI